MSNAGRKPGAQNQDVCGILSDAVDAVVHKLVCQVVHLRYVTEILHGEITAVPLAEFIVEFFHVSCRMIQIHMALDPEERDVVLLKIRQQHLPQVPVAHVLFLLFNQFSYHFSLKQFIRYELSEKTWMI